MDATNVQLPTVALALEALDLEVVPAASPTHTEFFKTHLLRGAVLGHAPSLSEHFGTNTSGTRKY